MNEPVIEIVKPCEHGNAYHSGHMFGEFESCPGPNRVRYSRQEAIDLITPMLYKDRYELKEEPLTLSQLVAHAVVDALLGASE